MIHNQFASVLLERREIHVECRRVAGIQGIGIIDCFLAVESTPIPAGAVVDKAVEVLEAEMVGG